MPQQLTRLARPFPDTYVATKPKSGGASYVSHDVVTQALLAIVGPYSLDVVEVIRGHAPEVTTKSGSHGPYDDVVVGVLARLTVIVDGRQVQVTEAGDVESAAMKDNDGARLKDAMSDAIKRCAMRLGLGLHLWSSDGYFLYEQLSARDDDGPDPEVEAEGEAVPTADEIRQIVRRAGPDGIQRFGQWVHDRWPEVERLEELDPDGLVVAHVEAQAIAADLEETS